jgi:translation initiation factor 3 subunit K
VIAISYQTIPLQSLSTDLNLDGNALNEFVCAQKWSTANTLVALPPNESNQPKPIIFQENIKFEQLASALSHGAN